MQRYIQSNFCIIGILCFLMFSAALIGCGDNNPPVSPPKSAVTTPMAPAAVSSSAPVELKVNVDKPKSVASSRITDQGPNGEGLKDHTDKQEVKIYHLPDDPYYSRTTHVSGWFFTEKDAQRKLRDIGILNKDSIG